MFLNLTGDSNPYTVATDDNFTLAQLGIEYCTNALTTRALTDPRYVDVASMMTQENQVYQALYQKHFTGLNQRGSNVLMVNNLFNDLKDHLADDWEYEISKVLRPGTPAYDFLFPHALTPFKRGSQQSMTLAVQRLGEDIAVPALSTLRTTIVGFGEEMETKLAGKDGQKVVVKDDSNFLEIGRIRACDVMLGIYGQCMFFEMFNRSNIRALFPFELFERAVSDFKEGAVAGGAIRQVKRQRSDKDVFVKLKSPTNTELRFYRAAHKGDQPGATYIDVPPYQEVRVRISAIGAMELPLILVKNLSETEGGYYSFAMEKA